MNKIVLKFYQTLIVPHPRPLFLEARGKTNIQPLSPVRREK
jgi:hypothetical protein